MALLMDQSRSVLPLRSAKAREFGELWREKCTRAPWTFPFKPARISSFRPARMDKCKATLAFVVENWLSWRDSSSICTVRFVNPDFIKKMYEIGPADRSMEIPPKTWFRLEGETQLDWSILKIPLRRKKMNQTQKFAKGKNSLQKATFERKNLKPVLSRYNLYIASAWTLVFRLHR